MPMYREIVTPEGSQIVQLTAEEEAAIINAPQPVPEEVRQAQARRALLAAGLLTTVEAAVAASLQDIQIAWEYEPNIRRDSPMIAALAPALGLTDAQIDDLFRAAAAIT
ncbi:MAG: hypothetical protein EBR82_89405 [Caulobacteraceae bacterium]|nr:hypothetical protein [Caulobacteraceae bacterium]NDC76105.1 hypothetical protein [bacterium]